MPTIDMQSTGQNIITMRKAVGMTVKDLQDILDISRSAAYKLLNDDTFPSVKIGSLLRVSEADFWKWCDSNKKGGNVLYGN